MSLYIYTIVLHMWNIEKRFMVYNWLGYIPYDRYPECMYETAKTLLVYGVERTVTSSYTR